MCIFQNINKSSTGVLSNSLTINISPNFWLRQSWQLEHRILFAKIFIKTLEWLTWERIIKKLCKTLQNSDLARRNSVAKFPLPGLSFSLFSSKFNEVLRTFYLGNKTVPEEFLWRVFRLKVEKFFHSEIW